MSSRAMSARPSRRFHLRQQTAREHAVLDGLVAPWATVGDYRGYLRAIADFRIPAEQMLDHAAYGAEWQDFRPLSVGNDLKCDLRALGMAPSTSGPAGHSGSGREWLFGTLYTLEGSNLGAQVLYQRATALGLDAEHGCAHLQRQVGAISHWRQYLDLLEAAPDLDMDQVCDAARMAFDHARQSFERAVCERC